jgi:hypothetical protein
VNLPSNPPARPLPIDGRREFHEDPRRDDARDGALSADEPRPELNGNGHVPAPQPMPSAPAQPASGNGFGPSCTAPQLRRFIKSRPYVPMHELRRRFGIVGDDDDVSAIDVGRQRLFVGLPLREGSLVGELLRGGDIGYELSLDPRTPIVIGLYPMRPVARS